MFESEKEKQLQNQWKIQYSESAVDNDLKKKKNIIQIFQIVHVVQYSYLAKSYMACHLGKYKFISTLLVSIEVKAKYCQIQVTIQSAELLV